MKKKVFISYSRRNLAFVEQLAFDLKEAGLDVWYDLSGLDGGARWRVEIEKAIRSSQYVLVVLSPASVASDWVEREYLFASNLGKKIIPLYYKACDLPMSYLTLHYIDIQGKKYYQKFNEILRAIGEHPVEQKKPSVPIQEKPISVILEEKVASVPRAEPSPIAAPQKFRIGGVTILIGGIIAIAICIGVILISNLPSIFNPLVENPTMTPHPVLTFAAQTVEAALTQSANSNLPIITQTTVSPSQTPAQATATPSCDKASFIKDVTIPDGTTLESNKTFTKTWRFKNVGLCTWTSAYAITFLDGDAMSGPAVQAFLGNVLPGQSVDISIQLRAPNNPGAYRGNWMFQNGSGTLFGHGEDADTPFWVEIKVTSTP
jgi:hypothetical protein